MSYKYNGSTSSVTQVSKNVEKKLCGLDEALSASCKLLEDVLKKLEETPKLPKEVVALILGGLDSMYQARIYSDSILGIEREYPIRMKDRLLADSSSIVSKRTDAQATLELVDSLVADFKDKYQSAQTEFSNGRGIRGDNAKAFKQPQSTYELAYDTEMLLVGLEAFFSRVLAVSNDDQIMAQVIASFEVDSDVVASLLAALKGISLAHTSTLEALGEKLYTNNIFDRIIDNVRKGTLEKGLVKKEIVFSKYNKAEQQVVTAYQRGLDSVKTDTSGMFR